MKWSKKEWDIITKEAKQRLMTPHQAVHFIVSNYGDLAERLRLICDAVHAAKKKALIEEGTREDVWGQPRVLP